VAASSLRRTRLEELVKESARAGLLHEDWQGREEQVIRCLEVHARVADWRLSPAKGDA
jgi:hypothetical protein